MSWNAKRIDAVAVASAPCDYAMFEAIGLDAMEHAHVLDVGCFDGFNTVLKFAPYENIERVCGIDPAADALKRAKEATDDPRFTWEMCAAEDFSGHDGEFDVAYFSHVFQHTRSKEQTLQRIFAALKPGGFVAIKTVDDSCNMSDPDPLRVMRRLYALYEQHVLPNTPHTCHTDRNNGAKCYGLLKDAGFVNVAIRTVPTDTANKSLEDRLGLFERTTYFRRNVPGCVDETVDDEIHRLLVEWEDMFKDESYYFATQTFLVLAQKPFDEKGQAGTPYAGSVFGSVGGLGVDAAATQVDSADGSSLAIRPMAEADLGNVMAIELKSFPDPWTPLAYAMELRHNPTARYVVALRDGKVAGYAGHWTANGVATLTNVAVDPGQRKAGVGRALLKHLFTAAIEAGCTAYTLQVRAANAGARAFYASLGFTEASITRNYYTNPDDDAVILVRQLDNASRAGASGDERQAKGADHG